MHLLLFIIVLLDIKSVSSTNQGSCVFWVEMVTPHLAYLHPSNFSSSACDLSIGALVRANSSLGLGVVSAEVGEEGLMVNLFQQTSTEPSGNLVEWKLQGDVCWFELQELVGFHQSHYVLDVGDQLHIEVVSRPNYNHKNLGNISANLIPSHFGTVSIIFDDSSLFEFTTSVTHSHNDSTQTYSLDLWQASLSEYTQSEVMFQLIFCPQTVTCIACNISLTIQSGCPSGKHLVLTYPTTPSQEESELYHLPVNYRPPSDLGLAISTSPHVYNVHPSLPLLHTHLELSHAAIFKQCQGKVTRSECNCSEEQTTSVDIQWSDCIQKVYKHSFADYLPLEFSIVMGDLNETTGDITSPIHIEELNNRTDYRVSTSPSNEIEFSGPGLYHFKAELRNIQTFCQITTQFAVFVVEQPLMKSEDVSITGLTAIGCGLLLFLAYLFHHHFFRHTQAIYLTSCKKR